MKTTLKKLLALTLAVLMLVGVLAACAPAVVTTAGKTPTPTGGNENPTGGEEQPTERPKETLDLSEPVTLHWYSFGSEQAGTADVIAAVNELLKEALPNTTLKMTFQGGKKDGYQMALAAEETIDIAWEGYYTGVANSIMAENMLPLDDLIYNYAPNISAEIDKFVVDMNQGIWVDGVRYTIPCLQPVCNESQSLWIMNDYVEYFDIVAIAKSIQNNDKLTKETMDLFSEGMAKAAAAGAIGPNATSLWKVSISGIDNLGYGWCNELYDIRIDLYAEDAKWDYRYNYPEINLLSEYMVDWYQKGYFSESQLGNVLPSGTPEILYYNESRNQNWSLADENGIVHNATRNKMSYTMILTRKPESTWIDMAKVNASNIVIPYTSKNPERAMAFIDLLHDPDPNSIGNKIYKILCYGFEMGSAEAIKYGWFNYELVSEGGMMVRDTTNGANKHTISDWAMGNSYNGLSLLNVDKEGNRTISPTKETIDYCLNFYNNVLPYCRPTTVDGFRVVLDESVSGYNLKVIDEERQIIHYGTKGAAGTEAALAAARSKMDAAGGQQVLAFANEAIQEYWARTQG